MAIIIVLAVLLMKEVKRKRKDKAKQEEQDRLLTRYVADNLDMEKRLSDMEHAYDKQQEMDGEIRRIQQQIGLLKHDMKNHTMVILSYLEENRTEEAKQYAGEILDKLNRMYTYVNVGNSLLSHIINTKLSLAKEKGIEIKAEIENLPFSYMDSVDFSSLLNNMLDNAVNGALDSDSPKLEVDIASKKGFDMITVKNSIDHSVLRENPELASSKEEPGHGYGMKQMKAIVQKYEGDMDIYEKGGMFIVSVMLG
ncbi:MAG: GHKL domain-containing protein [Lachnospiraceae bacterium]|nr:GHKL domain-containing protein [Lachnospiraceae bacterium]MBD5483339.1 GHKL domain-containing protein [Lachnospiraceae bacterium]